MYQLSQILKLVLVLLTFTFASQAFAQEAEEETTAEEAEAKAETTAVSVEDVTRDRVLGDEDAPLTIIEYASFTCPHCVEFEKSVWPKIEEEYIDTGKAKFIYREVYFDGAGLLAASLARCVTPEQYYPMVFTLYDNNETWLTSQNSVDGIIGELTKIGVMAGLSKDNIATCLDDRNAQEAMLANSQNHMERDNVRGTPTLIINGELVKNWQWDNLGPFLEEQYEKATK